MYFGITLSEHLDYNVTAKIVAQSAGRVLGLIARYKNSGGLPYSVYTKLKESCIVRAPLFGEHTHSLNSCINAVHHRTMRFFLDIGKYTPNTAVYSEIGRKPSP